MPGRKTVADRGRLVEVESHIDGVLKGRKDGRSVRREGKIYIERHDAGRKTKAVVRQASGADGYYYEASTVREESLRTVKV